MDNSTKYFIAAGVTGGLGLGFAGGYLYAFKKFRKDYDEVLSKEIKEAKEYYATLYKAEYPTPADLAAERGIVVPDDEQLAEATTALRSYLGQEVPEETVEVEVEERNIFDNGDQPSLNKDERDLTKPYVVDYDEYTDHPEGYDEIQLTYYAGDNVLSDDEDQHIPDADAIVGNMNLHLFGVSDPDDPHILLIRNDQKKMDIEVTYSGGKYALEVLGFQHSEEPMRRVKPRWDDER